LPSSGALDPTIEALPFSLDKARALLKEAGWTDSDGDGLLDKVIEGKKTPFEFTMLLYNKPEYSSLANIFKEDLLKVGVRMTVSVVEWSLMQKRMEEKNFDAYTGGWGMTWDTDPFQIWHSTQADVARGSNKVGFRSTQADGLIKELRSTFEPEKRKAMLHEVHRIIHEAQPYSFFMVQKFVYCWRKEVKGVRFAKVRPIEDYRPWWVDN
jgi:ABC-type transport system substrate-binding protein